MGNLFSVDMLGIISLIMKPETTEKLFAGSFICIALFMIAFTIIHTYSIINQSVDDFENHSEIKAEYLDEH